MWYHNNSIKLNQCTIEIFLYTLLFYCYYYYLFSLSSLASLEFTSWGSLGTWPAVWSCSRGTLESFYVRGTSVCISEASAPPGASHDPAYFLAADTRLPLERSENTHREREKTSACEYSVANKSPEPETAVNLRVLDLTMLNLTVRGFVC